MIQLKKNVFILDGDHTPFWINCVQLIFATNLLHEGDHAETGGSQESPQNMFK